MALHTVLLLAQLARVPLYMLHGSGEVDVPRHASHGEHAARWQPVQQVPQNFVQLHASGACSPCAGLHSKHFGRQPCWTQLGMLHDLIARSGLAVLQSSPAGIAD